jgi:hypothetical protein
MDKQNMGENEEQIQNQHFDEAMELSSNENSVVTDEDDKDNDINPINNNLSGGQVNTANNINRNEVDGVEGETSPITGQYNPTD